MLLSISKKAVTETDCLLILEQAYGLERPFGVPTLILNTNNLQLWEDLAPEFRNRLHKPNMAFVYGSNLRLLRDIFSETLDKCPEFSEDDALDIQMALCTTTSASHALNDTLMGHFSACSYRTTIEQYNKDAHHYIESSYDTPAFNTVFMSRENFSAQERLASSMKMTKNEIEYLPGYDSQYHFFILFHEIGHGTGAGEAQTDMMAAIACRQAFDDTRFISVCSDFRALDLLYNMDGALQAQGYHWSMIEGLDHIIAMDQSTIDAMNEDDIKALRFKSFPYVEEQWDSIQAIFSTASTYGCNDFSEAYKKGNLHAIAQTIRDMPTCHLPDDTRIIAARLALATERLSTPGAYETTRPLPGPQ